MSIVLPLSLRSVSLTFVHISEKTGKEKQRKKKTEQMCERAALALSESEAGRGGAEG